METSHVQMEQNFHSVPLLSLGSLAPHKLQWEEWCACQTIGIWVDSHLWHKATLNSSSKPGVQTELDPSLLILPGRWEAAKSSAAHIQHLPTCTFFLREKRTRGRSFAENIFCLLWLQPHYLSEFSLHLPRNDSWAEGKAKTSWSPLWNFITLKCKTIHRNTDQLEQQQRSKMFGKPEVPSTVTPRWKAFGKWHSSILMIPAKHCCSERHRETTFPNGKSQGVHIHLHQNHPHVSSRMQRLWGKPVHRALLC